MLQKIPHDRPGVIARIFSGLRKPAEPDTQTATLLKASIEHVELKHELERLRKELASVRKDADELEAECQAALELKKHADEIEDALCKAFVADVNCLGGIDQLDDIRFITVEAGVFGVLPTCITRGGEGYPPRLECEIHGVTHEIAVEFRLRAVESRQKDGRSVFEATYRVLADEN